MSHIRADYHIHSYNSCDSQASPEEIAKMAVQKGITEICLTEHQDLYPGTIFTEFYKDETHSKTVELLQLLFKDRLKVKKGVEVDFHPETIRPFQTFIQTYRFDFILASVHMLEHEFIEPEHFRQRDPEDIFERYFASVLELSSLTSFDVVGHLDYVKRHSGSFRPDPARHGKILRQILSNLVKNGKGIELNTSGWRQGRGEPYPAPYILKLFRETGGEIITIGSDSHRAEDVGADFDRALHLLKEMGFDGYYVFTDRVPEKVAFDN